MIRTASRSSASPPEESPSACWPLRRLPKDCSRARFRKAADRSAPPRLSNEGGENVPPLAVAESNGTAFLSKVRASSIADARKKSSDDILKGSAPGLGGSWPNFDGYVLPDDQYKLYEAGKYNDTPILIGSNADEGALFVPTTTSAVSRSQRSSRLRRLRRQDSRLRIPSDRTPSRCARPAISPGTPLSHGARGPGRGCNRARARAKSSSTTSVTAQLILTLRSSRIGARPTALRLPSFSEISLRPCPPTANDQNGGELGLFLLGELREDGRPEWLGHGLVARLHRR